MTLSTSKTLLSSAAALSLVWVLLLAGCVASDGSDAIAPDDTPEDDAGMEADLGNPEPDAATPDPDGFDPDPDLEDVGTPDPTPDMEPEPVPMLVTCTLPASTGGELEVNTWRGDVERVAFEVPGLPDPAELTEARLLYFAYDADHPGEEGWIEVNGGARIELPADLALDNVGRQFDVDVTGQTTAGNNRVEFIAFDGPEGAFYRISQVAIQITGFDLGCGEPTPLEVVEHPAPAGVSAFAALAPSFPRAELLTVLSGLSRPFTTVLLDFGPVYDPEGVQMFSPGNVGAREPNPAHFQALIRFVNAFIEATPGARSRHLQLYLLNGPGVRRPGYARAYPQDPEGLDRVLQNDMGVRAELQSYLAALTRALAPLRDRVELRLAVGLEDNMTQAGASAARDLVSAAGWEDPIGRNPCGCGFGDTARVGDFHENHVHSLAEVAALPGDLSAPDAFSNDGWGFTYDSPVTDDAVIAMARRATATGLWFHLWYDPAQGYPIPDQGPRSLRFDDSPVRLHALMAQGLTDMTPPNTGNGVERVMNYREADFDERRNWVLNCRDYAYTARFDEHRECDNTYNPDGSGHGRATFTFEGVIADRYEVALEGRNTENRNPAGALVIVNGVEQRLRQIGEGEYAYVTHGTYNLSGTVTIVLDSTREAGSDSVRHVRIRPVR